MTLLGGDKNICRLLSIKFSSFSSSRPSAQQTFHCKHSCCLLLNSYTFTINITLIRWIKAKSFKGERWKNKLMMTAERGIKGLMTHRGV